MYIGTLDWIPNPLHQEGFDTQLTFKHTCNEFCFKICCDIECILVLD